MGADHLCPDLALFAQHISLNDRDVGSGTWPLVVRIFVRGALGLRDGKLYSCSSYGESLVCSVDGLVHVHASTPQVGGYTSPSLKQAVRQKRATYCVNAVGSILQCDGR